MRSAAPRPKNKIGACSKAFGVRLPGRYWREMFFEGDRCGQVAIFDAGDKAVAAAGQGLDVTGFLG